MDKVFIIAEAGVNHNGNPDIAKKLIDAAKEAGADAVKFQTFSAEKLVCRNAKKADYQLKVTDCSESQYHMLKRLELKETIYQELLDYSLRKNIMLLSTPFDEESLEFLCDSGMEIIKLPSGEITNFPLLKKAAEAKKDIILSSGMSTLEEIQNAIVVLTSKGSRNITVLHCTTDYPARMSDINLKAMLTIEKAFHVKVGYSDHSLGIEVPIAAVAMGASVIEKHFTLDKNMEGPDHKASLEPYELKQMVQAIRNIERAMGDGEKKPSFAEQKNIKVIRKSIVAAEQIKKGELFTEKNLTAKRPGDGISPMNWEKLLGKKAIKDFQKDELIIIEEK